jgi:DNA-binding NarL/FixJ family response regulator
VPRILIADDSRNSRYALRKLLEGHGYDVCGEAEDGLSAVEKSAALKPDLVILDFKMPHLNGLEAGQAIHTANPGIPLLLFTLEHIEPSLLELAREAGFRGALAKGEGIFALSEAVEVLLKGETFFLSASESRLPAAAPRDAIQADKSRRN